MVLQFLVEVRARRADRLSRPGDVPGVLLELPLEEFALGTIFEFATAEGGRLLVCGYNLVDQLEQRPATRQLRNSLLAYAASEAFAPTAPLSRSEFERLFPVVEEVELDSAT